MHANQSGRHSAFNGLNRLVTFTRKLIAFVLITVVLTALSHGVAHAQYQFNQKILPDCEIEFGGVQSAQKTVSNQPLKWVDVQLPDLWESRWPGYSGTVLYKINWSQHCRDNPDASLALGLDSINMAGEVILNGQRIWKDIQLTEPLSRSWNTARYWIQPTNNFLEGENQLLIKVVGVATQSPGLGRVYLGTPEWVIEKYNQQVFSKRTLYLVNLVVSITLGVIGFLIWMFRRQDTTFGWFALASALWAIFISNTLSTTAFPFSSTMQLARFNISCVVLYAPCFAIHVWRFAGEKFKKTEWIFWSIAATLITLITFTPAENIQPVFIISFLFAVFVFVYGCIVFQWIALKTKKIDVYFLAIILLGFLFIICHDAFRIFTQTPDRISLAPFAAPLMTIAISLIFAWRIAHNINKIEFFNEQLESKIELVKIELKQSLDNKHQLELDNMRLQERLNLSHDLHDGLGGSLVRSIALVDHSEQFDKQNFMSILKLLRNDLRQIIDSGSSVGAKIPETPILWGAPLRHRYIQLFDQLDIESEWNFSDHWQFLPSALECLTLARVTEEALTNIIKHSQATTVKVSLQQNSEHKLELRIQDNGVGFDPSEVQHGMHVGLHSMQIRVARIGANIDILSQVGQTCICVKIPHHAAVC